MSVLEENAVNTRTNEARLESLLRHTGKALGVLVIVVMVIISVDVIFRYILNRPIVFIDEISVYALVLIGFGGLAYAETEKMHVKVDILTNRLSPKMKHYFKIAALALELPFAGVFAYSAATATMNTFARREILWGITGIGKYYILGMIAIGVIIFALLLGLEFIRELGNKPESGRGEM